jgi:hypothetical protein
MSGRDGVEGLAAGGTPVEASRLGEGLAHLAALLLRALAVLVLASPLLIAARLFLMP